MFSSFTPKQRKVLKFMVYFGSAILAGYYGASFAQSQQDMAVCQREMTICQREFSIHGFEVIGK